MLLKFAKQLLCRLWRTVFGEPILTVKDVGELPDRLDGGIVYLVGEDEYLWFAAMICPCGMRFHPSHEPNASQSASMGGYQAQ